MSRIHDALKKAAEEKSSRGATGANPDFLDAEGDLHRPVGNSEIRCKRECRAAVYDN